MKHLFIKSVLAGSLLLVGATGCKKFLEQEVPGRLTEEIFYKTDEDATQAVSAIYDVMSADYNSSWTSTYMLRTMLSDESNAGGSGPGDQEGYQRLDDFSIDADNDKVLGAWRLAYGAIYRANKVINSVLPENKLRKERIAEAKILRAYNYLTLVSFWGDVPLVITDILPSQYTTVGRAKKEDVYKQIVKDLTEALVDIPAKSAYSAGDKFRVSKGTAQALLGKALLYQEKWAEAAAKFEELIGSGEYSLESSVGKVFSKAGEFGVESIFEINFADNYNYNWGNFPWDWRPESNIHIQLMGPRADYYTKAPSDSLLGGWGFVTGKKKLFDAFEAAGDVKRRWNTIMSEEELKTLGGNWTSPTAWDYEGYFQRKYGSFVTQTSSSGGNVAELNYGTNWRLVRYADVLLMAAEAYYRAGNEGKARTYLNQVRQRPGTALPDVTATGAALFSAIVLERQLELAFEGHRFIDLVRWGLAQQELGPLGFQARHALLPIPSQDIRTAGLIQNTGY